MKTKKMLTTLLIIIMTISMTDGFVAKAAKTITVTLRMEQDNATLTKPVSVTMTENDIKAYGSMAFSTDTMTPYHVLAKYLITEKGATEDTLADYLLVSSGYLNGISLNGNIKKDSGSPSVNPNTSDCYWMYAVNDSSPVNPATGFSYSLNEYPIQDNDELVFYGVWGGDWENSISSYYTTFDKKHYAAKTNEKIDVSLLGLDIFNDYGVKANRTISGAHITVTSADGETMPDQYVTGKDGKVSLCFPKQGVYTLSAYRKTADGVHYDISRPFATVTVTDTETKPDTPITTPPDSAKTVKPSKVKGVKASVKKTKKKKKKIAITWKKAANASGYEIYLSKKKGYKKAGNVTGTKKTIKRKKGTYFVKIRAYNKQASGTKKIYGAFSKVKKIKVK